MQALVCLARKKFFGLPVGDDNDFCRTDLVQLSWLDCEAGANSAPPRRHDRVVFWPSA